MTPIKSSSIYKIFQEKIDTDFEGTIIDIETIGNFGTPSGFFPQGRDYLSRYRDMRITTIGTLSDNLLRIFIAKNEESMERFQRKATKVMRIADSPTYAFSKSFEEGCFYWNSGHDHIDLDCELQSFVGESKKSVVAKLEIDNYDDPFHDIGRKCVHAFEVDDLSNIIKHNRACLLKENQILQKRGVKRIKTKWLDL